MKKFYSVLLVASFLLAACGGGIKPEEAETALTSYFAGDRVAANEYMCNTQRLSPRNADTLKEMSIEVKEVSCKKDSGRMACSYELASGEAELSNSINFTLRSGKLCTRIPMPEFPLEAAEETEDSAE